MALYSTFKTYQTDLKMQLSIILQHLKDDNVLVLLRDLRDALINNPVTWQESIQNTVIILQNLQQVANSPVEFRNLINILQRAQQDFSFKQTVSQVLKNDVKIQKTVRLQRNDLLKQNIIDARFDSGFEEQVNQFMKTYGNLFVQKSVKTIQQETKFGVSLRNAVQKQFNILNLKNHLCAEQYVHILKECLQNPDKLQVINKMLRLDQSLRSPVRIDTVRVEVQSDEM
ncbi:Hypothetical_protein [Hexamita inflata]|uniref:Hypothetical_protein n=1 Tax=Hexamita inflata TaxID=28002 RepID=A0ABP1J6M5_9EUKA